MVCKLCGKKAPLRHSHILPELVFSATYDSKHRALQPDKGSKKVPYVQKGWREELLCDCCEGLLSKLEHAFSQMWYNSGLIPTLAPRDFLSIQLPDYRAFKLFHLSILWRASVSMTSPFDQVNLGPYEDRLRDFILSQQAPAMAEYPLFGFVLRNPGNGQIEHAIVMPPTAGRLEGVRAYSTIFGGCAWYYFVSGQRPPLPDSLMLDDSGRIRMPVLDYTDHVPIQNFVRSWRQTQRRIV